MVPAFTFPLGYARPATVVALLERAGSAGR